MAAFALATVDNPHAVNQRIDIGGPASYTWTQIVETAGRIMGMDLPVQYLPLGTAVPLLPPAVSDLLNGMETFEASIDMTETAPAYGVTLTTLVEFIEQTFAKR